MGREPISFTRYPRAAGWAILLGGVVVALLTFVRFYPVGAPSRPSTLHPLTQETTSWGEASSSIDIQPALLSTYYEHGLEHTPPRDPTGAMQRREAYYRAPPDPWDLLERTLGTSAADERFREHLAKARSLWLTGHPISSESLAVLQQDGEQASASALALVNAGRAFDFLVGDELAAAFYHAAFIKAEHEDARTLPGDPTARPLLRQLDQTAALWRLKDYPALELRFALARRLNPQLSVESRRAGCLQVDALYYQDRFDEAADLILAVQKEDQQVGDLGALERSDLYEMEYMQGYVLAAADRFDEAIPHLLRVCRSGEHARAAADALFRAYLSTGRFEQARVCYSQILKQFNLPQAARLEMQRQLQEAVLRHEWQQQASASAT